MKTLLIFCLLCLNTHFTFAQIVGTKNTTVKKQGVTPTEKINISRQTIKQEFLPDLTITLKKVVVEKYFNSNPNIQGTASTIEYEVSNNGTSAANMDYIIIHGDYKEVSGNGVVQNLHVSLNPGSGPRGLMLAPGQSKNVIKSIFNKHPLDKTKDYFYEISINQDNLIKELKTDNNKATMSVVWAPGVR